MVTSATTCGAQIRNQRDCTQHRRRLNRKQHTSHDVTMCIASCVVASVHGSAGHCLSAQTSKHGHASYPRGQCKSDHGHQHRQQDASTTNKVPGKHSQSHNTFGREKRNQGGLIVHQWGRMYAAMHAQQAPAVLCPTQHTAMPAGMHFVHGGCLLLPAVSVDTSELLWCMAAGKKTDIHPIMDGDIIPGSMRCHLCSAPK